MPIKSSLYCVHAPKRAEVNMKTELNIKNMERNLIEILNPSTNGYWNVLSLEIEKNTSLETISRTMALRSDNNTLYLLDCWLWSVKKLLKHFFIFILLFLFFGVFYMFFLQKEYMSAIYLP